MKFAVALCLLLATSGFALMPKHPADLVTMLTRQQFAMRQMMAAPEPRDDASVNDCFNNYLTQQTNVIMNYNKEYTGCLNTAEEDRQKLTQESASEREDLIQRTNNMCTSLTACDTLRDGLDFFQCYRDASTDSYKTMFTLNSDSNLDYNRISASYSVIETALTTCVDEARVTYAHDMDTCDESLTVCLNGGAAPTDAPVSTTPPAPTSTPAPTTTAAPVTTEAPVVTTSAPVVTTSAPVVTTEAPVVTTSAPVVTTDAPVVTTSAPVVTTEAPVVTTSAPVVTTSAPVVTTSAPVATTDAPVVTTSAPVVTTDAPVVTTSAPVVTTDAPVVTTEAPVVTTSAPVVTTSAPVVTTSAPVATTDAPAVTTGAPINTDSPTTERAPEEDLDRSMPLVQKGIWNLFKRYI
ncbi:hypothetical protein KR054_001451 [Drosophila jambulina]|nr:hypothetical protein KR054_001451 [Drosophila jambulina]